MSFARCGGRAVPRSSPPLCSKCFCQLSPGCLSCLFTFKSIFGRSPFTLIRFACKKRVSYRALKTRPGGGDEKDVYDHQEDRLEDDFCRMYGSYNSVHDCVPLRSKLPGRRSENRNGRQWRKRQLRFKSDGGNAIRSDLCAAVWT